VEDAADTDAARFKRLAAVFDAFDVQQHVVGPTHNLDRRYRSTSSPVATFSGFRVDGLAVDPPGCGGVTILHRGVTKELII